MVTDAPTITFKIRLNKKAIYLYLKITTMKYLKTILTIIAFNLTVIMLQNANIIPAAKANAHQIVDVNISRIGGGYVSYGGRQEGSHKQNKRDSVLD